MAGGSASAFALEAPLGVMERPPEDLPLDVLAKANRVSMAVSLKVRVPLRGWAEDLLSDGSMHRSGATEPVVASARREGFLCTTGRM